MKRWIKEQKVNIILCLVILIGIGLLSYPTVSDWWNSFHQTRAVASYAAAVSQMKTEDYDRLFAEADDYNRKLAGTGMKWSMTDEEIQEYNSILDISENGIMGYIDIPRIRQTLPIYHGTDDAVLQIAIGHLAGTSLPVGGDSTHCVVSGHRGLPSARLFTDLDRLIVGDIWTMTVLNRTVTYEVDQIRIVEPEDLSELQIVQGRDYCTLLTCTPYGINSHRLLVRGHRIANLDGDANVTADAMQVDQTLVAIVVAIIILLILCVFLLITSSKWYRQRRDRREMERRKKHLSQNQ
jgi:sortase A